MAELYKRIKWNEIKSATEEQFLSENFYDLHRLSFYPFEVKNPQCKLHEAVLAAEVLRERPDCDDGFQINAGKKAIDSTGPTPINYLPVNPELLKAQAIVKILNDAHTGLKQLFEKRFIPELTQLTA